MSRENHDERELCGTDPKKDLRKSSDRDVIDDKDKLREDSFNINFRKYLYIQHLELNWIVN